MNVGCCRYHPLFSGWVVGVVRIRHSRTAAPSCWAACPWSRSCRNQGRACRWATSCGGRSRDRRSCGDGGLFSGGGRREEYRHYFLKRNHEAAEHYKHPPILTKRAVAGAEVSIVRFGREDPVPAELLEVDLERPFAARCHIGVIILIANSASRPLNASSPSSILDVDLKIRPLWRNGDCIQIWHENFVWIKHTSGVPTWPMSSSLTMLFSMWTLMTTPRFSMGYFIHCLVSLVRLISTRPPVSSLSLTVSCLAGTRVILPVLSTEMYLTWMTALISVSDGAWGRWMLSMDCNIATKCYHWNNLSVQCATFTRSLFASITFSLNLKYKTE